jgi:hypothetical protein
LATLTVAVLLCLQGLSLGAELTTAKQAYDAAYALQCQGKEAEAEAAYKDVVDRYAWGSATSTALLQLAGVQASLGKTEDAYQSFIRHINKSFDAQNTPPAKRWSETITRAQARWNVAYALLGSSRDDKHVLAKAQFEILVKDFSGTRWGPLAKRRLTWLNSFLAKKASENTEKAAITKVIKAYETAMKAKGVAAAIGLLATPPQDNRLNTKLQEYMNSASYEPYEYTVRSVKFSPDMSKATVMTHAEAPNYRTGRKLFRLIKTADGWKLQRL